MENLELRTVDGKLLRFYDDLNTNELLIQKGSFHSGVYIIKALLDNGQVAIGKVVAR